MKAVPVLLAAASCFAPLMATQTAAVPPNIVVILSDDQGWTDYGFMGHPDIQTPHLDRLAANSLLFERGYVAAPICRPSLASIVTGLFPSQHGVVGNDVDGGNNRAGLDIPLREAFHQHPSFVRMLTENGYLAHQSGKWWEGSHQDGGFTHGMTHGDPERGGRHGDDGLVIGREGMEPIAEFLDHAMAEKKPFLVWYAPFLPHTPHNPPQRLLKKYVAEGRELDVAKYYAMCEWFDETCGELLDLLDKRGLTDSTLVLYICDNGRQPPSTNADDPDQKDWRYALRTKGSPFEQGIRTPIMISQPGKVKPENSPHLAHAIDLFPTIAAAAGLTPPPGLHGINLLDPDAVAARERVFAENHSSHNITIGNPDDTLQYLVAVEPEWKLILRKSGKDTSPYHVLHSWDTEPARLYNIKEDPAEENDLADQHPEQVKRLTGEIEAWQQSLSRGTPKDAGSPAGAPMQWTTVYPGNTPGEWFPRPLPLTELTIARTIQAADFGAVPDDGQCDVKAISSAIEALRDAPGTKLVFEKGTYDLIAGHDPSGKFDPSLYDSALDKAIFELVGLRDVQIDFGGSLMLVGRTQATFMMVSECENVIVENFELDYATQPYTIGTIVALDTAPGSIAFDFEVHDGYLLPDDRFFLDYIEDPERSDQPTTRTWGYVIDPAHPGRLKAGTWNVFFPERIEKIAERTYRYHVTYPNPAGRAALNLNGVEVGDIFTYLARGGGGFIFRHADQFTVRNATFYSNGGANFQGTFSNCLNFLGVHIKIKDGRWKTSNADGFIFHSLRYGPWIEACTTEGMADDTVNVHIRPHFIQEVVDARTLRLGRAFGAGRVFHTKNFSVGDRASFFDGASGRVLFEAVATEVKIVGDEGLVSFDRDLPELKPGDDKLAHTTVYNVDRSIGTVVRNNQFGSARRHGVLIRSEDALIENNHFEGLSSDAINFSNESGWPEGLFAKNALIRNNTILNCGFEQNYMRGEPRANITIHNSHAPKPPEGVITHRNIVIEGNSVDGWYRRAIFLAHAGHVLIRNNTFGPPIKPLDPGAPNEAVIVIHHSEEVTLTDNTFPPGVPEILK